MKKLNENIKDLGVHRVNALRMFWVFVYWTAKDAAKAFSFR